MLTNLFLNTKLNRSQNHYLDHQQQTNYIQVLLDSKIRAELPEMLQSIFQQCRDHHSRSAMAEPRPALLITVSPLSGMDESYTSVGVVVTPVPAFSADRLGNVTTLDPGNASYRLGFNDA